MTAGDDTTLTEAAALEAALLSDFAALVALRMACDLGAMAGLARGTLLASDPGLPPEGARLLLAMLRAAGIAEPWEGDRWMLTPAMAVLWSVRGASVEARARFVLMAAGDVIAQAPALFRDPRAFVAQARTFGFFDYGRAMRDGAAAQEDSAPWVRYVSALNADEAPYLAPLIPLDGCATLLEVGGNTGGFARALLALHPGLRAMVFDLPAVCSLGRQAQAEAERLSFHPGDARAGDWPMVAAAPPDAVLFKSVLHDWDAASARDLLDRAARHVAPGGRVIVCERGAMADEPAISGLSAAANLVFAPFYRAPQVYEDWMTGLGLCLLPGCRVRLDMAFHIISAERPA